MKTAAAMKYLLLVIGLAGVSVTVAADKFNIEASTTMKDVLTDHTGNRVALRLVGGDEVEGTVTRVGTSVVHLSKLKGMEFYDAVLAIENISAVRIRVAD